MKLGHAENPIQQSRLIFNYTTMATNIPAEKAALVMNTLKDQANKTLGPSKNVNLEVFHADGAGNFPYNFEDPNGDRFNIETYKWMNKALQKRNEGDPVSAEGDYNGKFRQAITKVNYNMSTDDQEILTKAKQNTIAQQRSLIKTWQEVGLSLPDGKLPIDGIVHVIRTEWTSDEKVSLRDMQNAPDLFALLDNAPASGMPVIPIFGQYLQAIGDGISVVNDQSLNDGILSTVRSNSITGSKLNGGIQMNDGTDIFYPAYEFSISQEKILNELRFDDNSVEVGLTMTDISETETSLSVGGDASFKMPLGFFDLHLEAQANFFTKIIAKQSTKIEIDMIFRGVTVAKFGPQDFLLSSRKGWHFPEAPKKAIQNGDQDITGFQFAPKPNFDFGENGDFGYINAVAISQYPEINLKIFSKSFTQIDTELQAAVGGKLKIDFLGIPMSIGSKASFSGSNTTVNETEGSVSIKLSAPKEIYAGTSAEETAYVLGVQTEYSAV